MTYQSKALHVNTMCKYFICFIMIYHLLFLWYTYYCAYYVYLCQCADRNVIHLYNRNKSNTFKRVNLGWNRLLSLRVVAYSLSSTFVVHCTITENNNSYQECAQYIVNMLYVLLWYMICCFNSYQEYAQYIKYVISFYLYIYVCSVVLKDHF